MYGIGSVSDKGKFLWWVINVNTCEVESLVIQTKIGLKLLRLSSGISVFFKDLKKYDC